MSEEILTEEQKHKLIALLIEDLGLPRPTLGLKNDTTNRKGKRRPTKNSKHVR